MQDYERLECEIAKLFDTPGEQVTACSSGTAALHTAIECLNDIPTNGSHFSNCLITCDYNMVAVPRAGVLAGFEKILFCDCDDALLTSLSEDNAGIGDILIEALVNQRQPTLVIPHLFGKKVDMEVLHACVDRLEQIWDTNILVIEDMAELHGPPPHPKSDAACWSFYKNKVVRGEEGGAVWFNDKWANAYELSKAFRSLGMVPGRQDYVHAPRGHNYRLSNCHAKLILDSMENFKSNLFQRVVTERTLRDSLPREVLVPGERISPWFMDVRLPNISSLRWDVMRHEFARMKISWRESFKPMSCQQEFCNSHIRPNALKASKEVILIDLHDPDNNILKNIRWMSILFKEMSR